MIFTGTTSIPRSRSRAVALAVGTLLALSACAGIPSSGPVTKVADDGGLGESTVRYTPARPAEGASPREIVRGYLDAMLAYPASSGTATAFLTPAGAKEWSPAAGVRVYSSVGLAGPTLAAGEDAETTDKARNPVDVVTRLVEDARLDRQGHYTRRARPAAVTYRLERVDSEWRIANPQAGLLVSRKFFDDYFRPFNIYNFDRSGQRLVPDPIHVLVGDQLATGLVTSLARGPAGPTAAAVRTYVPPLSSLRPSVPVSDQGVADVEFNADFAAMSEAAENHLSAQLVWTLRQVSDVTAVRLAGSAGVLSGGGAAVQDITSWGGYGPSVARGHAYALRGDRVVQIDGDRIKRLSGAWGKDAREAVAVGVSEDGVAGVLPGRRVRQAHRPQGRRSAYVRRLTIHHAALGRRRPCLAGRPARLTDPRATCHERPDPHARGRQPGRPRCQDLRPVTRRLPLCRHGAGPGRGVDPDRLGQARHAGPHPGPRRRVAGLHDGSLPAIGDLVVRDRAELLRRQPVGAAGLHHDDRRVLDVRRPGPRRCVAARRRRRHAGDRHRADS